MSRFSVALRSHLICGLVGWAFLSALQLPAGEPLEPVWIAARWFFVQGIVAGASWVGRVQIERRRLTLSWRSVALLVLLAGSIVVYISTTETAAAWAATFLFYLLLVAASGVAQRWPWGGRIIAWILGALAGGVFPVALGQIESRFSEEEFFAALQALSLSAFTFLMIAAWSWASGFVDRAPAGSTHRARSSSVSVWMAAGTGLAMVGVTCGVAFRAYQHSFYSTRAPTYAGITSQEPFICGQSEPDAAVPDGVEVFQRLLARVEANPHRSAPEYGMLALATGEPRWAEAFREAILNEARAGMFTEPANSVKFGQYLAAQRVYYFARVAQAFPGLFSDQEVGTVHQWFADVNRRALTVEWVDWLYALAFSYWPEGPYGNQENGVGLLASLEDYGLADGALSVRNRDYLARNRRGWMARFRNTDDAYTYQPEWIENALFQAQYWESKAGILAEEMHNRTLAFEWLLLQALPDGSPLGYNHPVDFSIATTAYLGAELLQDPRYVWWSARMLDWVEQQGEPLYAQPGVEQAASLVGVSPDVGSCLIFGNSGLPTQQGVLAPDKIVFRDGWSPESRYLLLNLRFSGWHRYKATNAVTLLYQGEPLAIEQDSGESFSWLPVGRSLFRDKRIPRENLNGLLIPRTGMSAVLQRLAGFGGPWAQDPPYYAEVVDFETGRERDYSHTAITDWHGWTHEREIYFYHDGPIVIVDRAQGPGTSKGALAWHLPGTRSLDDNRVSLREGALPVEAVFLPLGETGTITAQPDERNSLDNTSLLYQPAMAGQLNLATVFLTGDWYDARVEEEQDASGDTSLHVVSAGREILIPLGAGASRGADANGSTSRPR